MKDIAKIINRVGGNIAAFRIKNHQSKETFPQPGSEDASHGQPFTDCWEYSCSKPMHMAEFWFAVESEHECLGGTETVLHVAPAETDAPSGGDIPTHVCRVLGNGWGAFSWPVLWAMTPDEAKVAIKSSWPTANEIARLVMAGDVGPEWLPEGSEVGAGGMWLGGALETAFKRGVNPLPLIRKLFPNCSWEFSKKEVSRSDKGVYPIYDTGDVVSVWRVLGGWVVATLIGERTNSPL